MKYRVSGLHVPQFFFLPMPPPHVLVDIVVLSPGHGSSVTDFWGWDAHEAKLRCPDYVSDDIGVCSARRALKPKFYQTTQTMVTAGIFPFRENSHGRARNKSRDLMISSQRLWPLDHGVSKIKHLYVRTDFRSLLIHTSSIHKNALHDLTLIKPNVARFEGTGGFLTRYSNGYTITHRK